MATYTKKEFVGGDWLPKDELIKQAPIATKIVEEVRPIEGDNGQQDIGKVEVNGDVYKVSFNRTSINALVEAYGTDSANWVNKPLTLHMERGIFGGKRGIALYAVPEGFELVEGTDGYLNIEPQEGVQTAPQPQQTPKDDIPIVENETDDVNAQLQQEAEKLK